MILWFQGKHEVEVMPGEKRERQKGAFCDMIPWELREVHFPPSYTLTVFLEVVWDLASWSCFLQTFFKLKHMYISIFCFKILVVESSLKTVMIHNGPNIDVSGSWYPVDIVAHLGLVAWLVLLSPFLFCLSRHPLSKLWAKTSKLSLRAKAEMTWTLIMLNALRTCPQHDFSLVCTDLL